MGSKPLGASPYGALDMAGNLWEWTADLYPGTDKRIIRGGSWFSRTKTSRASHRNKVDPKDKNNDVGFRCVQDL